MGGGLVNTCLAVGGFFIAWALVALFLNAVLDFAADCLAEHEGVRPRPASDDELYGLAHGDGPANPESVDVLHRSGDTI